MGIETACSAAASTIAKTSSALRLFTREVREARAELDAVHAELHSLERILEIFKDGVDFFPSDLAERTPPLLTHCTNIVDQIGGYMHVCNGLSLSKRDKKYRWLAVGADMVKLRMTLEGYKSTLALVVDLVGLNKLRRDNDAVSLRSNSSGYYARVENQTATNDEIMSELAHIMADMGTLRGRLQGDFRSNYAVADLESYLDAMQLDATNLGDGMKGKSTVPQGLAAGPRIAAKRLSRALSCGTASSVGDEPDSAIDVNDGPRSPCQPSQAGEKRTAQEDDSSPPTARPLPIVQIDSFLQELSNARELSSRAPTPPPKAAARGLKKGAAPFTVNQSLAPNDLVASSSRSESEYSLAMHDTEGHGHAGPRHMKSMTYSVASSDDDAKSTLGSLRNVRPPFSESDAKGLSSDKNPVSRPTAAGPAASAVAAPSPRTTTTMTTKDVAPAKKTGGLFGRSKSFSLATRPTQPVPSEAPALPAQVRSKAPPVYNQTQVYSRSISLLAETALFVADAPRTVAPPILVARPSRGRKTSVDTTNSIATNSSGGKAPRRSSSVRSNSSRISSVFSKMTHWRSSSIKEEETAESLEPDDIFGVSLKKSIQMAPATARTHHGGSKGSSRREFPRCILMCVSFINDNEGVKAPGIFAGSANVSGMCGASDHLTRVAALKEAFSTAPHYGEGNIDWTKFTVHDAAELIVLFLQQMPKPLVTETVAKRWIVLSRQATVPGSMGMRLDSCIDFWDEALLGVRGPASNVLKLLLNLWGDIADAADVNEMTAERLAARLLSPLMQLPAGKYTTDYMLGLAFLIRKRSEYAILLRDGRTSNAAF
ncbi:unnamed protein product [Discula destructiva]